MRFVIDEDMPRSLARLLRESGFDAEDVRDLGLRGCRDEEVLEYACRHEACLITEDLGFANILRFRPGDHYGVVVGRFDSRLPVATVLREILDAIKRLEREIVARSLIIVEPGRYRVRTPKGQ